MDGKRRECAAVHGGCGVVERAGDGAHERAAHKLGAECGGGTGWEWGVGGWAGGDELHGDRRVEGASRRGRVAGRARGGWWRECGDAGWGSGVEGEV